MKMNIRKKLVNLAVASALSGGALMTAPAMAMNVSDDNLGQVLLFPYYTVKSGFDTLFSVTNTSNQTAVMKIRWREALNSREVRDFNVILSPQDVWTGVVTSTTDGALVRTYDKTCTSPILPAGPNGSREVAFTNLLFSGNFEDGATGDMSRVKEGYFEVFLMGLSSRSTTASSNVLEYNAKHVNGTPRDCAKVDALFLDVASINGYMTTPQSVLKGHTTFINVANGKAIDTEPTAIENFKTDGPYVYAPGDLDPSLASGTPFGTAWRLVNGSPNAVGYIAPVDGVSDLLRATSVINEYVTGSNAAGSWVLTFPTKHHYTDSYTAFTGPTDDADNGYTASGGFSEWFYNSAVANDGKSCDNIAVSSYDREEFGGAAGGTDFSPAPIGSSVALCYEANVIDFNGTSVFGSGDNHLGFSANGAAGWAKLTFSEPQATTYGGLPVIGFSAVVRDGADATVNYGSATEHSTIRPILPVMLP